MTDRLPGNPHRLIEGRSLFEVTEQPLSVDDLVNAVLTAGDGAVVTFVGTVRDNNDGRSVIALEYEAYAGMAEGEMERIASELKGRHDLVDVAIHHRIGPVEIGETSVVIAVSAAHRHAALAACKEAIDTLKETVPLWKKEVYEGGEEWIGRGS